MSFIDLIKTILGLFINQNKKVDKHRIKDPIIEPVKKTIEHPVIITPIYETIENLEDLSDPDEVNVIVELKEETKISPNISTLIDYIRDFKITRKVDTLFLHCTATPQTTTITSIQDHWRRLGWKNPGYHIIVKPNGEWSVLLNFNGVSNGVRGYNSNSINISYIGGIDRNGNPLNNMTTQQIEVFKTIIIELRSKIKSLKVRGHNEVSNKACPSFNTNDWLKINGLV